jgi:hypothetical protein
MFTKKTILIALAVLCLMGLVFFFFINKKESENSAQQLYQQNIPQQTTGTVIPTTPLTTDRNSKDSNSAETKLDENIQKNFSAFISQKPTESLKWAKIYDSKNQPATLDKFLFATGMTVDMQLKQMLNNNFDLFVCKNNFGIILNMRLMPSYQGNLYQDETSFMKNWEKSILKDTAKVVFPNFKFTEEQLQQPVVFKDVSSHGIYRYADIILPDKSTGMLAYTLVDDYVIISSSRDCLDNASEQVFSTKE